LQRRQPNVTTLDLCVERKQLADWNHVATLDTKTASVLVVGGEGSVALLNSRRRVGRGDASPARALERPPIDGAQLVRIDYDGGMQRLLLGIALVTLTRAAVAEVPGPCAPAPYEALPFRPYDPPCPFPENAEPLKTDVHGFPFQGTALIDSEERFARVYECKQPSGIDWARDRLLLFRARGDSATVATPNWVVVDGKRLVFAISWSESCQSVQPTRTYVMVTVLVPNWTPRPSVPKFCNRPEPPCTGP
jgi:hypothetical protein